MKQVRFYTRIKLVNLQDFPLVLDVLYLVVSDHFIDWDYFEGLILPKLFMLTEVNTTEGSWNEETFICN